MIFEFFSEQKERIFCSPFPLSRRWSSKKGASLRCLLLWCAFVFLWWFEKRERERRRENKREFRRKNTNTRGIHVIYTREQHRHNKNIRMKILRKNEGLVSNFEMCELLKQRELKRHEQVGGGTEVGDEENNEFDNNNNNNNTNSYDEGMPIDEHDDEEEDEEEFVPLYPTPHAPFETEILMLKEFKEKGVRVGKHERQMIQKFIEGIVELDLTKAETLMLINLRPSGKKKHAIVKAIVESSAERFASEEELDDLLTLVKKYLL